MAGGATTAHLMGLARHCMHRKDLSTLMPDNAVHWLYLSSSLATGTCSALPPSSLGSTCQHGASPAGSAHQASTLPSSTLLMLS